MAPNGTPHPIIARVNNAVNRALGEPAFRKRVMDMGLTVMGGSPEEVTTYIDSEARRWSELVRSAGIKID
jgi:tripartite-type tricarboxylate transporter receptor subunit TctC